MPDTGTLTETAPKYVDRINMPIQKWSYAWTSDASGNVTQTTTSRINGTITNVVSIPAAGASAPSANWDMTIKDENGNDILNALGSNLSETAVVRLKPFGSHTVNSVVYPFDVDLYDRLQINITNAGNTKSGTLVFYVR